VKIGFSSDGYSSMRSVVGAIPDADYEQVRDLHGTAREFALAINRVTRKLFGRKWLDPRDRKYRFDDFGLNRVGLLHLFNATSRRSTPWVSTFETVLPRLAKTSRCHSGPSPGYTGLAGDRQIRQVMQLMAGSPCKRLIAMSHCSLNMQRELVSQYPEFREAIEAKLIQLHPPQPILIDDPAEKPLATDGPIRFMFVGSAFFRKGGFEILETFSELRAKEGFDIDLTIVGSLRGKDYSVESNDHLVPQAQKLIDAAPDWIHWHRRAPNQAVLRMMKESHVGLLPTYADTYGYSLLEFQAAGCPVISTDVRALPEINNEDVGWMIPVPKNRLGQALYSDSPGRARVQECIREGLKRAVREIFRDKEAVIDKSGRSIARIRQQHSVDEFALRLSEIYHEASSAPASVR
jgi:glycosyltransferase involved in cell wall biosynthesis